MWECWDMIPVGPETPDLQSSSVTLRVNTPVRTAPSTSSGRRELNPRPRGWQPRALPLSYTRMFFSTAVRIRTRSDWFWRPTPLPVGILPYEYVFGSSRSPGLRKRLDEKKGPETFVSDPFRRVRFGRSLEGVWGRRVEGHDDGAGLGAIRTATLCPRLHRFKAPSAQI